MTLAPAAAACRVYSSCALIIDSLSPVQLVCTRAARITSGIVASSRSIPGQCAATSIRPDYEPAGRRSTACPEPIWRRPAAAFSVAASDPEAQTGTRGPGDRNPGIRGGTVVGARRLVDVGRLVVLVL